MDLIKECNEEISILAKRASSLLKGGYFAGNLDVVFEYDQRWVPSRSAARLTHNGNTLLLAEYIYNESISPNLSRKESQRIELKLKRDLLHMYTYHGIKELIENRYCDGKAYFKKRYEK